MSASAAEVGRKVICADGWRVTMHIEVRRGPLQGPDSERQGPTNRMSAAMFSGSPHSTRATTSDRPSAKSPQKQPTKRPERERSSGTARGMPGRKRSTPRQIQRVAMKARGSSTSRSSTTVSTPPNGATGSRTIPGFTRRGDRCGHVGGSGKRGNLCAPLRFGLHRRGHELAAC